MTPASMPAQLGRYKLLRPLGQGGMGAVWVALDTRLNREVALKFPLVNAEANPVAIERFQREARLAASIDHPNFCPVHDVGDDQGYHYYVMPIIAGKPLTAHWQSGEPWPLDRAASLIAALASALAELHARGIVHRDLKPANVMVRPDGSVVLMDFGLARTFEGSSDGLTGTGQSLGTPSYMAPEQAIGDGSKVGPAADVWALGVMLYQLIAGCLPFQGTGFEVMARILHMQPAPPSEMRPVKDARLDAICLQILSKEPAQRPESMKRLVEILSEFGPVSSTQPLPKSKASPLESSATLLTQGRRPQRKQDSKTDTIEPKRKRRTSERTEPSPQPVNKRWLLLAAVAVIAVGVIVLGIVLAVNHSSPGTTSEQVVQTERKDKPPTTQKPGVQPQVTEGRRFENSIGMDMIWIRPGTFMMGSPDTDMNAREDERPQHRVTISRGFWIASREVTVGQFKEFAKATAHPEESWKTAFEGQTDLHPVVRVSWHDAMAFCAWLSQKEQKTYDLPTEAEWEYCCRANTTSLYHCGDQSTDLKAYGWHKGNANMTTHLVGAMNANWWSLNDMHGNVAEWCKDQRRVYSKDEVTDPIGTNPDKRPVVRGGAWYSDVEHCRSADRDAFDANYRNHGNGFRVVVRSAPRNP